MANKPAKGAKNFGKPSSKPAAAMPKAKNSASKKK
jgi:hypothetical protein